MAHSRIKTDLTEPIALQKDHVHNLHDDIRPDPYYWLNDRENPEVIAYLNAENAFREQSMAPIKSLEDGLYQEIIQRIAPDDQTVPVLDNGYYYTTRFEKGKEHPVYWRRKAGEGDADEIYLDVNALAEGHDYYDIAGRVISPDNTWLAFGEDTLSRRIYTIRFKNLLTGEIISSQIPGTSGSIVWANDSQTVFYVVKDETLRPCKIYRHCLGQASTEDVLVFEELDDTFHSFIYKTRSKQYIVIGSEQTITSESRYVDANHPDGPFLLLHPRERGLEYQMDHFKDQFFIRTNWNARNFCLMTCPVSAPEKSNWKIFIPPREDILLEDATYFKDFMVFTERIKGINNVRILSWDLEKDHYINFGEEAFVATVEGNPEWDTNIIRIYFTSMTTPMSVLAYDPNLKSLTVLKEDKVIGDFDKSNYASERLFVKTQDGVQIPVSLVYRKGFKKDGSQPLLLYGYGSYGISLDPYFSSARLSLLDRGFAFAIAHVRGGEELGRAWYDDGKLLNKKNTFTDFITCAEYLISQGYTRSSGLFAMGGSAGGLLIGAVMNLRPDLFQGMIAAVPFVDVVTTMLDTSIPLTTGEFDEWGNPTDANYYQYIRSYSPYDNTEAKAYPALLVTTGLYDSQVQYWEPAKWVARLREKRINKAPLLLYCNMKTGHGGASGRFEKHKETAMAYAFLIDLAGLS